MWSHTARFDGQQRINKKPADRNDSGFFAASWQKLSEPQSCQWLSVNWFRVVSYRCSTSVMLGFESSLERKVIDARIWQSAVR
jgi:hypothetical protein